MTETSPPDDPSGLFPPGNPLRWLRGGVTAALGSFGAYALMAHDAQLRLGVPVGTLLVLVAAFGVMDLLGTFDVMVIDYARHELQVRPTYFAMH